MAGRAEGMGKVKFICGIHETNEDVPVLRYHDFFRQDGKLKNSGDIQASKRPILGARLGKVKAIINENKRP
jgi:hypothetical protein